MPQIVYPQWKKEFAQIWNGSLAPSALPSTLYLGLLAGTPGIANTLSSLNGYEIAGGSYARIAIARNAVSFADTATGYDWQYSIPLQTFPRFSATPSPNGAAHWFLCDQVSGYAGNLYATGPLNPAAISTTLSAAAAAGANTITIPAAQSALLSANDWLLIGTTGNFNPNQQLIGVSGANASTGVVTLAGSLIAAHVISEPVTRDGATRFYGIGDIEKVTSLLIFGQG